MAPTLKPKYSSVSRLIYFIFFVTGFILIILGVYLIYFFRGTIKTQISNNVLLRNGSKGYESWLKPPVPVFIEFNLFTIVNYKNILKGEKPIVKEIGPYVYQEIKNKNDISINNKSNNSIFYNETVSYHFIPYLSKGKENDTFIGVNLPLVTMATKIDSMPFFIKPLAKVFFEKEVNESIFQNYTVKDYIWGYEDSFFKKIKQFLKKYHINVPFSDVFGIFAGSKGNNTSDGVFTINSGIKNVENIGKIISWNNQSSLSCWTTLYANMINGTDGSIQHPFFGKTEKLYIFSPDICRSIYLYYSETKNTYGIKLYRYSPPKSLLHAGGENIGFCFPNNKSCLLDGVMSLESCTGAPMVVSLPHFTDADPTYVNSISGMHPGDKYKTFIDIEPYTGAALNLSKKLQLNIILKKLYVLPDTKILKNITIFPLVWFDEHATINPQLAVKFQNDVYWPITVAFSIQYGLMGTGILFVLICFIIFFKVMYSMRKRSGFLKLEDQSDLLNSEHTMHT